MERESRIYVAGHRGLVGSALVRKLREKGYKRLILKSHSELDLIRQKDVEEFFSRERPSYVFLAAAKVGGILANNTYKAEFIYENLLIAANVIHASYRFGVKKLLNLGSSCIYPRMAPQPMKEEYLLTGSLEPTNEPYAVAKIAAIKLCRYYNEQYRTNFLSIMVTNLYGPGDNFNLETAHVIPALIRKFHLAKLLEKRDFMGIRRDLIRFPLGFGWGRELAEKKDREIEKILEECGITSEKVILWGSGEPYREFLFVDDLADACIYLMENYDAEDIGEFVNVGTGRDLQVRELAEIVKSVVGFEGDILWDRNKPDGTPRKLLDVSRINKLSWRAKTSLKEGIGKTYAWYEREVGYG